MRYLPLLILFIIIISSSEVIAEDDVVRVTGYVLKPGKGATFEMPYEISIDWFGTQANEVRDSQLKIGDIYIYAGDILVNKFFPWEWKAGINIEVKGEEVYRSENKDLKYTYTVKILYLESGVLEIYVDNLRVYSKTFTGANLDIAIDDDTRIVNVFNIGSNSDGDIVTDEPDVDSSPLNRENYFYYALAGIAGVLIAAAVFILTKR